MIGPSPESCVGDRGFDGDEEGEGVGDCEGDGEDGGLWAGACGGAGGSVPDVVWVLCTVEWFLTGFSFACFAFASPVKCVGRGFTACCPRAADPPGPPDFTDPGSLVAAAIPAPVATAAVEATSVAPTWRSRRVRLRRACTRVE
jgi:hypothetical protein